MAVISATLEICREGLCTPCFAKSESRSRSSSSFSESVETLYRHEHLVIRQLYERVPWVRFLWWQAARTVVLTPQGAEVAAVEQEGGGRLLVGRPRYIFALPPATPRLVLHDHSGFIRLRYRFLDSEGVERGSMLGSRIPFTPSFRITLTGTGRQLRLRFDRPISTVTESGREIAAIETLGREGGLPPSFLQTLRLFADTEAGREDQLLPVLVLAAVVRSRYILRRRL